MEKFKKLFSENKTFSITLLICVIITLSIMIFLYKFNNSILFKNNKNIILNNDELKAFEPHILKLHKINLSLKDCINNKTINTKVTPTILSNDLESLKVLKEKVSSTIIENNSSPDIISKIILCIEDTENLYRYCLEVLSNNNNLSISEITSKILILKENCKKSYSDLSPYGFSLILSKESEEFLDTLIQYLNTLEKVNKEQLIKTSQYNAYIEKLNKNCNELSYILDDLEPVINLIRKEKRSLDVILEDIKEKEIALESIKKDFNYSSIPDGYISYYNSLNNIFTLYSTYLNTLKIAVIYEKSSTSYEENKKAINKNYDNAYSKYDDVKTSFESLINSF